MNLTDILLMMGGDSSAAWVMWFYILLMMCGDSSAEW